MVDIRNRREYTLVIWITLHFICGGSAGNSRMCKIKYMGMKGCFLSGVFYFVQINN